MSFLARRATVAVPRLAASRAFSSTPARPVSKITLVGNLAATPEVTTTNSGRELLKYAVATNSGRGENRKTSWFRISAFVNPGPQRDFLQSLPKGTSVYVEGEVTLGTWEDSEGKRQSALNIVQRQLEVLRKPAATEPEAESEAE